MRIHIENVQTVPGSELTVKRMGPPEDGKPTFGWGKHSVRLYAGRHFGAKPRTPCP